jgi:site-specific DNA recombinase
MGSRRNGQRGSRDGLGDAKPTRVVGYIRVSTAKQAEKGMSLEAQQAKLQQYAELYELQLVETCTDAASGKSLLGREGLAKALAMLEAGKAEGLVICKLDRLTRSVRDLGDLIEGPFEKSALLSVGEQIDTRSAAGRLVMNVLASVSQWEREAIGERTSVVMQQMKTEGIYTGGLVLYGFRAREDGQLEHDEKEQAIIELARYLRGEGESFRAIVARLADNGYVSRTGKPFNPAAVMRMVEES